MGLDITAYRSVKLDTEISLEAWNAGACDKFDGDGAGRVYLCVNGEFREAADGLVDGLYVVGETFGFRAGSYSGYNEWRDLLAKLVGTTAKRMWARPSHFVGTPFLELISFSDCEGLMGPKTCAKLAKDFEDMAARAAAHADDYWRESYGHWRKAFTMAAAEGAVQFH
jgi:hypothetical protein